MNSYFKEINKSLVTQQKRKCLWLKVRNHLFSHFSPRNKCLSLQMIICIYIVHHVSILLPIQKTSSLSQKPSSRAIYTCIDQTPNPTLCNLCTHLNEHFPTFHCKLLNYNYYIALHHIMTICM